MTKMIFHPFFVLLAHIVNSQLIEDIKYLKVENEILRSKLGRRITLTAAERTRLLRFGKPLGPRLKELISIVTYQTFRRWVNGHIYQGKGKVGRPALPEDVVEIVVRIAKDNPGWGYNRILGELKKLNIQIGRTSIQKILREKGLEPSPLRRDSTWTDFIKTHMNTLIACDFFTKEIWTLRGRVTMYVFFFIELGSRRVHFAGMTRYPNQRWVELRSKEVLENMKISGFEPKYLIRDRDCKFSDNFDKQMNLYGVEVRKTPVKNPSCNVYAERWVWSAKHECLNYFTVLGKHHLGYIVEEYVNYYNHLRPHQSIGNKTIDVTEHSNKRSTDGVIKREDILGGLLHNYRREAA
ncbi:MAG TPA: integrase core domain-containing protein [Alphaproteobacteria bacterium]|nr:integrase core domain-containing protein [Alphaproteobacteria bacterium]